jgi:transcriptional regulator with XRE-family HTH domain
MRLPCACEGPTKSGAYFAVKVVVHELKKAREAAGLTLADVSKRTGMDQATLSRLENGRRPNPTVDTLWRYASAVGRQLVLSHADAVATASGNGKATKGKLRKQAADGYQRRA